MTFVVSLIPPAALGNSKIEYFRPIPRVAFEHRVLRPAIAVFHDVCAGAEFRSLVAEPGRDRFHMRQILHGQTIVQCQLLAGTHLLSRTSYLKRLDMKREDQVGTQAADGLGDTLIQSAHYRRDADYDCNPDHDTEHGECGAHLVAADGVQRHLYTLGIIASTHNEDLQFKAERCNRVQLCRTLCRIHAEEQSHAGGNQQRRQNSPQSYRRWHSNDGGDCFGKTNPEKNSETP